MLVFFGVVVMVSGSSGAWTTDVFVSKTSTVLVGGFISVLGAVIALAILGALKDAAEILSDLWNGLVDAFR